MNADQKQSGFLSALTCVHPRLILAALLLSGFVGHVLYVAIDPPIDLAGDEAHYWDWSRQLDWSYYSKGPLVAVIIRASTRLFGDTPLGVRLPAMGLAVGTSLCTAWLTRRAFGSERLALGAVALTYCVPMFVAGSMLMTIDAPLFFCWGLATCFGFLAAVEGRRWAWPVAGACVGVGCLAKYAALLWLAGMMTFLLTSRRPTLRTAGPWAMIVIAFAFTTPVVAWNARHDWVTLGHVTRSTSENQTHFHPLAVFKNVGELVGGQIGLMNPVVFGFMACAVVRAWRLSRGPGPSTAQDATAPAATVNPLALRYLLAHALPFLGCVACVTLFKNTEPNWPAPAYFTLIPLAAWFIAGTWPRSRGWLIGAVAVGAVAVVVLHESGPLYPVVSAAPRKWDPSARLVGWKRVGRVVSDELKTLPSDAIVICDKYQLAGLMAFYVDHRPKTFCLGSYLADPAERDRLTQYDLWPDRDLAQPGLRGRDAVFVGRPPPDLARAFERVEPLPDLPIVRNGVTIRRQSMSRCYGFRGLARPTDGLTKR